MHYQVPLYQIDRHEFSLLQPCSCGSTGTSPTVRFLAHARFESSRLCCSSLILSGTESSSVLLLGTEGSEQSFY